MTKIYACLLGDWICLNDDPNSLIEDTNPYIWYEESALTTIRNHKTDIKYNSLYDSLVNICYKGITYRINPIFIQVVLGI